MHKSVICVSAGVCIFASMFAYVLSLFVLVLLYMHGWVLCVCALVCPPVYASIQGRNTLDMCPNTLRQCLFNHNLGLHESSNRKQTKLAGRLDGETARGERDV